MKDFRISEIYDIKENPFSKFFGRNVKRFHTKTEYKGVSKVEVDGDVAFRGQISVNKYKAEKFFTDIREAAKWYDLQRIKHGLEPINILKRK